MPEMGQIDEVIEVIKELHGRAYKSKPSRQWQAYGIVLSILSHVKEHGLSLTEVELEKIIKNSYIYEWGVEGLKSSLGVGYQENHAKGNVRKLAKAIVDKQKGK